MRTVIWIVVTWCAFLDEVHAQSPTARFPAAERRPLRIVRQETVAPRPSPEEPPRPPMAATEGVGAYALVELESMALANSPVLTAAMARVSAADGAALQAGLPPNPVIGYRGDEIGNERAAGMHGGYVGQEIVLGNKLSLSRNVLATESDRLRQFVEMQRLRVLTDTQQAFYQTLIAQRLAEQLSQLVKLAHDAVTITQRRVETGEAARADLVRAMVDARMVRLKLENTQARHVAAWQRLAAVINSPDLPLAPLDGDPTRELPMVDKAESLQTLFASSPELSAAQLLVDRACWAWKRAQAEPIPNVDVQAGVGYDSASRNAFGGVQASLKLPLWNRNQGQIQQRACEFQAARSELRRVELALRARHAAAFREFEVALQQAQAYAEDILPGANESLQLVQRAYSNGEVSYLEYLSAQRTLVDGNLAYLEAVLDVRRAAAEINGLLLSGSLDLAGEEVRISE